MRDRIQLLKPTVSTNDSGVPKRTYVSQGSFYAERVQLPELVRGGAEFIQDNQLVSSYFETWKMRPTAGLDASWRLQFLTNTYDIISVIPDGKRRRNVIVKCKRRDNG